MENQVLVYYPMDYADYREMIEENNMPYSLNYDVSTLRKADSLVLGVGWLVANQWYIDT